MSNYNEGARNKKSHLTQNEKQEAAIQTFGMSQCIKNQNNDYIEKQDNLSLILYSLNLFPLHSFVFVLCQESIFLTSLKCKTCYLVSFRDFSLSISMSIKTR